MVQKAAETVTFKPDGELVKLLHKHAADKKKSG
jgi:hypothetical protein